MHRPSKLEYIGIELPDRGVSLNVGHLPGRKSFALYFSDGHRDFPVAYFPSELEARRVISFLRDLGNRTRSDKSVVTP